MGIISTLLSNYWGQRIDSSITTAAMVSFTVFFKKVVRLYLLRLSVPAAANVYLQVGLGIEDCW
jgi:hypothetical protein